MDGNSSSPPMAGSLPEVPDDLDGTPIDAALVPQTARKRVSGHRKVRIHRAMQGPAKNVLCTLPLGGISWLQCELRQLALRWIWRDGARRHLFKKCLQQADQAVNEAPASV